jgi:hypothetical protein
MTADDRPDPVEQISEQQCWQLVRSSEFGRLAVLLDDGPGIFPINFVVDHATIVFRSAPGSKLDAALADNPLAFEVDGYDAESGRAWSVVVRGTASEITRLYDIIDTFRLPLYPWHGSAKHRFVRISPSEVSGRRFAVVDRDRWATAVGEAARDDDG